MNNFKIESVQNLKFGCQIFLHTQSFHCSNPKLMKRWDNMSFDQYNKWKWYFRYRQALIQVQNPRFFVDLVQSNYKYIPNEVQIKKRLQNKIINNKGMLTKWINRLEKYVNNWVSLFPIDDDKAYIEAKKKINALIIKISILEHEFNNV